MPHSHSPSEDARAPLSGPGTEPDEPPPSSIRRQYQSGETIAGRYQLERLIGRGGMGEVWTAHNTPLGVRQALKLIRADADCQENTDRLLYEARAAAQLTDPAIVRVFDFGKSTWGDPFIVMEYLEGEDLAQVIQRVGRLAPAKAVRTLLPVIRALGAAHDHGIVHRDLKPENIFLAKLRDGRVTPKLLDFGIAKLHGSKSLRLTSVGAVVGSPLYMSPEQARGEEVDERTDVWAMCVVLYEAISGELPFTGESRAEVLRNAAEAQPKSLEAAGLTDGSLWNILEYGMSKGRETRWRSMHSLGRALARWLLDRGAQEDITGASIEIGWLRESPRSFFTNTLRPQSQRGEALPPWSKRLQTLRQGLREYIEQVPFVRSCVGSIDKRLRATGLSRGSLQVAVAVGLLSTVALVGASLVWPSGSNAGSDPSGRETRAADRARAGSGGAQPNSKARPGEARERRDTGEAPGAGPGSGAAASSTAGPAGLALGDAGAPSADHADRDPGSEESETPEHESTQTAATPSPAPRHSRKRRAPARTQQRVRRSKLLNPFE